MIQKIIKVGNSYAVTIPRDFAAEAKFHAGDNVVVEGDIASETLMIRKQDVSKDTTKAGLTPEFVSWLDGFNKKYKKALTDLAKK